MVRGIRNFFGISVSEAKLPYQIYFPAAAQLRSFFPLSNTVSKPAPRKGRGQFCNQTYLPLERGLKESQIPLCDNYKKYCTRFFLVGIRINELSPTTVPYLFSPNSSMCPLEIRHKQTLSGIAAVLIKTKTADIIAEVPQARVCTSFFFLFSGRSFLCLPPVGAYIDTTTQHQSLWGESTSRLQKTETSNTC